MTNTEENFIMSKFKDILSMIQTALIAISLIVGASIWVSTQDQNTKQYNIGLQQFTKQYTVELQQLQIQIEQLNIKLQSVNQKVLSNSEDMSVWKAISDERSIHINEQLNKMDTKMDKLEEYLKKIKN